MDSWLGWVTYYHAVPPGSQSAIYVPYIPTTIIEYYILLTMKCCGHDKPRTD